MNIEAFLLCDAATDQRGKLNVLGAFDRIFAGEMPMMHPACAVAARIRFDKIEEGHHEVRLLMIDQDGKPLGPKLKANADIQFGDESSSVVSNLILVIHRLAFKEYGTYRIDLAIDGQIHASLPFTVCRSPNPPKKG